jgi:hypothetical protein
VNPFAGEWQITSTDVWETKELGAARLAFDRDRTGELELVTITASIDYRIGTRDGRAIQLGVHPQVIDIATDTS